MPLQRSRSFRLTPSLFTHSPACRALPPNQNNCFPSMVFVLCFLQSASTRSMSAACRARRPPASKPTSSPRKTPRCVQLECGALVGALALDEGPRVLSYCLLSIAKKQQQATRPQTCLLFIFQVSFSCGGKSQGINVTFIKLDFFFFFRYNVYSSGPFFWGGVGFYFWLFLFQAVAGRDE